MVWEQHCFCQIMDTNTKRKIAHLGYLRWAFSLTKDFQPASTVIVFIVMNIIAINNMLIVISRYHHHSHKYIDKLFLLKWLIIVVIVFKHILKYIMKQQTYAILRRRKSKPPVYTVCATDTKLLFCFARIWLIVHDWSVSTRFVIGWKLDMRWSKQMLSFTMFSLLLTFC